MVQVPAPTKDALPPDTTQTAGAVEVNVTGNPELADALNGSTDPKVCDRIEAKVMVCG
jgi:hypothetical protein